MSASLITLSACGSSPPTATRKRKMRDYDKYVYLSFSQGPYDVRVKAEKFYGIAEIERVRWRLIQYIHKVNTEYTTAVEMLKLVGGVAHTCVDLKDRKVPSRQNRYKWRKYTYYFERDSIGWDWLEEMPEEPLYEAVAEQYICAEKRSSQFYRYLHLVDSILDRAITDQLGGPFGTYCHRTIFIINGREYIYHYDSRVWQKASWPGDYFYTRRIIINGD